MIDIGIGIGIGCGTKCVAMGGGRHPDCDGFHRFAIVGRFVVNVGGSGSGIAVDVVILIQTTSLGRVWTTSL